MAVGKVALCSAGMLLLALSGSSQEVSRADSLRVLRAVDQLFAVFMQPNLHRFQQLAAEKISCYPCAELDERAHKAAATSYLISRQRFFQTYLPVLRHYDYLRRAYRKRGVVVMRQPPDGLLVLLLTWKPGEYAPGHEGAQLELQFVKKENKLLFSSIGTVP